MLQGQGLRATHRAGSCLGEPFDSSVLTPTTGPNVGPDTALMPQIDIAYARFDGDQMSAIEAPPVARTGDPARMSDVEQRKTR